MSQINLSNKLGANLLINPNFEIWQRGTYFTGAGGEYGADRWFHWKINSAYIDYQRSTDVPTEEEAGYKNINSLAISTITPDTSVAVDDFQMVFQKIEGYNFRRINNKNFVFSFWVKSPKIGIHCVLFSDATGYGYTSEYNVDSANTWQKVVIKVKHETGSGTWDYENGHGMRVSFILKAGTDHHTTPNVWAAGSKFATANQVNVVDVVGEFKIAQVQLHEGIEEISFEKNVRDFQSELQLCRRYFEKSYEMDKYRGDNYAHGAYYWAGVGGPSYNTMKVLIGVLKRDVPVITLINTATSALNTWHGYSGTTAGEYTVSASSITRADFRVQFNAVPSAGYGNSGHWYADSEL